MAMMDFDHISKEDMLQHFEKHKKSIMSLFSIIYTQLEISELEKNTWDNVGTTLAALSHLYLDHETDAKILIEHLQKKTDFYDAEDFLIEAIEDELKKTEDSKKIRRKAKRKKRPQD